MTIEVRLIDANALKNYIDCGHLRSPIEMCFSELDVVRMLDKQPTIEAAPIVHGRWNTYTYSNRVDTYGNPDTCAECSECRFLWSYERDAMDYFRYCPNCGAKMDLKENRRNETC